MADISITAANVLASASAVIKYGTAGATITQGQVVALSSSQIVLCDNNSGTAAVREPVGIAMTGASSGQRVYYISEDPDFTIGATVLVGDTLWSSATAGGMTKTAADNVAGVYPAVLGIMTTTTKAKIKISYAGAVIA